MKPKIKIPGIAIVAVVIVSIGLGTKGVRYILSYSAEEQDPRTSRKVTPTGSIDTRTFSSLSGMQLDRPLSDYQVVIENDLLKPLGWQKTIAMPPLPEPIVRRRTRQAPPAPASNLVFTGIVRLGAESIALIEDISIGEAYFLREGDKLKDYLVQAIAEENITLVSENSEFMLDLGSKARYSSNGQILTSELTDEQAIEDLAKGADEKTASSDEGSVNLSVIEQMKARRRKELGQ